MRSNNILFFNLSFTKEQGSLGVLFFAFQLRGGHQNAQFNDAITTATTKVDAITIAILDGVLYIPGKNKMYQSVTETYKEQNIMSALVLREFLYQI